VLDVGCDVAHWDEYKPAFMLSWMRDPQFSGVAHGVAMNKKVKVKSAWAPEYASNPIPFRFDTVQFGK
jgi:hypothetical protein